MLGLAVSLTFIEESLMANTQTAQITEEKNYKKINKNFSFSPQWLTSFFRPLNFIYPWWNFWEVLSQIIINAWTKFDQTAEIWNWKFYVHMESFVGNGKEKSEISSFYDKDNDENIGVFNI